MQHSSSDRDFAQYNAAQAERPVRPLARRAAALTVDESAEEGPLAIELGSGAGVEARFLAESGFTVHTFDADPSVEPAMARLSESLPVVHTTTDLEQLPQLPAADLVLSCATLSFVRRSTFLPLWWTLREAMRPRGIVAVDLFGEHDDWAGTDGTFVTRGEIEQLLEGLDVLELEEGEHDGRSFSGPKHWHTFRVIARRL